MKKILCIITLSTALFLNGCATTADYSAPVLRLEQAINDSSNLIESIDAELTARQNAVLKNKIVAEELLLDVAHDECAAGKKKCTLSVLSVKDGITARISDYPLMSTMPKGLLALQMVKTYVSRLKSIIEADTTGKVTASANETLGTLEGIANRLELESGKPAGKSQKIAEYKEPVIGLIEWITEKYVEQVKKEALAKAMKEAHPLIEDLTEFYATAAQSLKIAVFAETHIAFKDNQEKYDNQDQIAESSVDAYVQAAEDFDAALKAEAANPLEAFKAAHGKLMKQLNGEDAKENTLADVASAIERLEQEAKAIRALVDGFKKKI